MKMEGEGWERVCVCTTALRGCPDPHAFVAAAKKLLEAGDALEEDWVGQDRPPTQLESAIGIPALAWLREVPE